MGVGWTIVLMMNRAPGREGSKIKQKEEMEDGEGREDSECQRRCSIFFRAKLFN